MTFMLNIRGNNVSSSFAGNGDADKVEVTGRYVSKRDEAHLLLDRVLDALGVEEDK